MQNKPYCLNTTQVFQKLYHINYLDRVGVSKSNFKRLVLYKPKLQQISIRIKIKKNEAFLHLRKPHSFYIKLKLLYRNTLSQVTRLVNVAATHNSYVVA